MATTQGLFRVESASEWAKKNGITTWTKFHYGSQPEQSIFTPLDTWGHSLRQPYYGPIIESSQQYFLAVNWETEEEWDKFKLSPGHQQLMANLTTNSMQPETKIVIFTDVRYWIHLQRRDFHCILAVVYHSRGSNSHSQNRATCASGRKRNAQPTLLLQETNVWMDRWPKRMEWRKRYCKCLDPQVEEPGTGTKVQND